MLVSLVVNHVDALIYSIQILSHLFAYINSTITQMSFTSLNLKDNWYPYMYFYHIRLVCKKGKNFRVGFVFGAEVLILPYYYSLVYWRMYTFFFIIHVYPDYYAVGFLV